MTTTAPPTTTTRFYGKYRGVVLNNVDPMKIGRLLVAVPDVAGPIPLTWAMPCVPAGGPGSGGLAIPFIGAGVWVEFEQGDPERPIWVGGFWNNPGEVPVLAHAILPGTAGLAYQTQLGTGLVISDGPAGITLRHMSGAMIMINDAGIIITNGKGAMITLAGTGVDINLGALTVVA